MRAFLIQLPGNKHLRSCVSKYYVLWTWPQRRLFQISKEKNCHQCPVFMIVELPGQWYYELFKSSVSCPPPSNEQLCLSYTSATIDLNQYTLQSCPCNGQLAASDPRFHLSYIDWFRYCFSYNIPGRASSGLTFIQVLSRIWSMFTRLRQSIPVLLIRLVEISRQMSRWFSMSGHAP